MTYVLPQKSQDTHQAFQIQQPVLYLRKNASPPRSGNPTKGQAPEFDQLYDILLLFFKTCVGQKGELNKDLVGMYM